MEYLTLFFAGALSGLVAGVAGLGGGTVIVPALTFLFGLAAMHDAIVASWFAVLFNSFSATLVQYKLRNVEERAELFATSRYFLCGVVVVTPLVAMLVAWLSHSVSPALVGAFQLTLAMALLLPKTGLAQPRTMNRLLETGFGGLVGGASALTGTGGGAYTTAYMVFGQRRSLGDALATGNLTGLVVGLLSVIGFFASFLLSEHAAHLSVLTSLSAGGMILLIASGTVFSAIGVKLSRHIKKTILKRIVIAVLVVSAIRLLLA